MDSTEVVGLLGLILAVVSIILFVIDVYMRRPCIQFLEHKDEATANDTKRMWYHVMIRNKEPVKGFNRDAALECIARVDFLDKNTTRPLVSQITAHWTNQPEPRDYIAGQFDPSKIPTCQHIDVGFRGEMFDVLIKFNGEKGFVAADPWVVYKNVMSTEEKQRLKVEADECILRVEIEAINLGKRQVAQYTLRDKGSSLGDIEITRKKK